MMRMRIAALAVIALALAPPLAAALRPLRERAVTVGSAASAASWGDEVRNGASELGLVGLGTRYSSWFLLNLVSATDHSLVYTSYYSLTLQFRDNK